MKTPRIYTLTANPALDLSGHVDKILPDEKNYVQRARLDPGGNAINAARVMKRLGMNPELLGFLGGPTGEQIKLLLLEEGLRLRFTKIKENTRTNVTVSNDEDHHQTRLTFPGPKISNSEIAALFKQIKNLQELGVLVVGGSKPNTPKDSFYIDLCKIAQDTKLGLIIDIPAQELKKIQHAKLNKFLFIKPNLNELESLLNKKFLTQKEIANAAKKLSCSEIVCISLAEKGALFVWQNRAWLLKSPAVKARGTVGAGDSLVGAFAAKLAQSRVTKAEDCKNPETILEAAKWGVAAGAATASTEGTSLGDASLICELYANVKVEAI